MSNVLDVIPISSNLHFMRQRVPSSSSAELVKFGTGIDQLRPLVGSHAPDSLDAGRTHGAASNDLSPCADSSLLTTMLMLQEREFGVASEGTTNTGATHNDGETLSVPDDLETGDESQSSQSESESESETVFAPDGQNASSTDFRPVRLDANGDNRISQTELYEFIRQTSQRAGAGIGAAVRGTDALSNGVTSMARKISLDPVVWPKDGAIG
jgi:hypothetical protein